MRSIFITIFSTFRINKPKMRKALHQQSESIRLYLSNKDFFQGAINVLDAFQHCNTKLYGAENEITLNTKHYKASCLYNMGKYNEALEIFYQVEKIYTDNFGINHPLTSETKHDIANCLNKMGIHKEALEI